MELRPPPLLWTLLLLLLLLLPLVCPAHLTPTATAAPKPHLNEPLVNIVSVSERAETCVFTFKQVTFQLEHCIQLNNAANASLAWTSMLLPASDVQRSDTPPLHRALLLQNSSEPGALKGPGGPEDPESHVHLVLFHGNVKAPGGWATWASTESLQGRRNVLISYSNPSAGDTLGAASHHIDGLAPVQRLHLNSSLPGLLLEGAHSASALLLSSPLDADLTNGGQTLQLLALVMDDGAVNVTWGAGRVSVASSKPASIDFKAGGGALVEAWHWDVAGLQECKLAHAWLSALGFGVLLPAGILMAQRLKTRAEAHWYHLHVGIQVMGFLLGASGWALGVSLRNKLGPFGATPQLLNPHYVIGFLIMGLGTLQVLSPALKPMKGAPARAAWDAVHRALGYSTVVMSAVNVYVGLALLVSEIVQ